MTAQAPRRIGLLSSWRLSKSGGNGHVFIPATCELFFICFDFITSGRPLIGSTVSFIPQPPAPGAKYPQASDAIIDNARLVTKLDVIGLTRAKEEATKPKLTLKEVLGGDQ